MSSAKAEAQVPGFVRGYTVALFLVAMLAGLVAWLEVGLIGELEADGLSFLAMVLRVDQVVALALAPLGLLAVAARIRRWPVALLATRIISFALVIVFPIGTALFIYWFVRVRRRESGAVQP